MGQAGHPRGERECCARLPPRRCAVYRPRRELVPEAGRRSEESACRHERGRREHCRRAHRGNGHHQQTSALARGGRMTTKHPRKHWSDKLVALDACSEAVRWARKQRSAEHAWHTCKRGDWMIWAVTRKLEDDPTIPARRKLALCLAEIGRRSLRYAGEYESTLRTVFDAVTAWGEGRGSLDDLRAAESAARSAAWSAAESAESAARSAAWSAARSAAWSAESAAESAAWSAQNVVLETLLGGLAP